MAACGWATVSSSHICPQTLVQLELHDGPVSTGGIAREGLSLALGGGSEAADTDAVSPYRMP